MVFRVAADVAVEEPDRPDGPLAIVDSSGARGADGLAGSRGMDGSFGGGDGSRGGDAGPAYVGADAGAIRVELVSVGGFAASLTGEYSRGGERVSVDQRIRFDRSGQLEFRANGGAGGNGGRGGDGGAGGTGRAGSDATRYSSGSDGGRGGDGGNGGSGSHGARGGAGGAIVLRTSERDTHLLVLVHRECFGGVGGRAGFNGAGGPGGSGGSGGSSYSWTETEHYTDSQGQSQTRTTHHSNSGGSRGPSGSAGYSGSAVLRPGATGSVGSFAIEVVDALGATQRYPDRYDVAVLGFQHDNENRDGVYEPEEKVIVSRIAVKNVGAMPTPAFHDIVIGVVEAGWVDADESKLLTLPTALEPGQTHVFERETLEFSLHGHEPKAPGEPLGERETIRLFAAIPAANRRFGAFESTLDPKTGAITVRFPVEVSAIESLYSLAQGQATRVRFRLSNVALSALGRGSPGGREFGVRFRLAGGELYDGEVRVFDAQGARARLDVGWSDVITVIDPQAHRDFELVIAVAPDARPYTSARFELAAELAWLDDPKTARPVHLRDLTVRVGQPFSRTPADVLLLVNNRTDRHELAAWQQVFGELGLSHTLWDASLEGSVDVLAKDAPFSLAVVLDYEMDTASGATSASELVASERVHALTKKMGVLYVGDHRVLTRQTLAAGR